MAGLGGMGVLLAAELLALAALTEYRYVTWVPSYYTTMRGGPCECTVIFSQEEIASPLLPQAEAVIVFDASQLRLFEGRVRPGGLLVIEAAGLDEESKRDDVRVLKVPGLEIAVGIGGTQGANFVLLGTYVTASKAIAAQLVERELEQRFTGRESLLRINGGALRKGLELGKDLVA